jgi:cyclomaltodextrinase / maltogenic alpha-amylase / neopullulanase
MSITKNFFIAFLFIVISTIIISCKQSLPVTSSTPFNEPPAWSNQAIWYQIFVERFYNGDSTNDPKPENINIPPIGTIAPEHWFVTPWTHNWYERESWAKNIDKNFNYITQFRRFGGDLKGVIMKLDYLHELGISAIYLNPINDAPSLHKYDARSYHHVDVNFGPDPEGDNQIIATENPADPSTWKWTSADSLFLKLIEEAHKRDMKIIMDYSWNHTGVMFWALQDILKNQEKSQYLGWYDIKSFDDPATPQNEFSYSGWLGINSLPELKKVNLTTERKAGNPYEGDINPKAKEHIFSVSKRWLEPGGDAGKGVDGFRLDVADQIGLVFWRDYRKFVRSVKPDAYLVGEIWWKQFPDILMNPVPYTSGDIFDAVMFYQVYRPARSFFAKTDYEISAAQFRDSLELQWNRLLPANRFAMMNVSSTHDSPRLLTCFSNPNKYKYQSTPNDNKQYKTGKPDIETYKRAQLYLVHLFTSIGAPQIWNGEEMGMWGADDPDCRKPLWWKEFNFEPETENNYQPGVKKYDPVGFNTNQFGWYKKLISIRKNNPVLVNGNLEFIITEGKKLGYKRYDDSGEIIVLFNLEPSTQVFDLPRTGTYRDLLTDTEIMSDKISLASLTSVVLKTVKR